MKIDKNLEGLVQDIDSYIFDKKELSYIKGITIIYKKENENAECLFWKNVDYVLDKYNDKKKEGCNNYISKEFALKSLVYSSSVR